MIAFLHILSILHIAVCMTLRWLTDNCGYLSQHNFVVSNMAYVVHIMEKAFYKVLIDREKLIDKYFMMGIFDGITKKLPSLQQYLYFVSRNKQGILVGSRKEEEIFFHGVYCDLNCFILLSNILLILTHFLLNSHAKQRQSSELISGTIARP